ncbi:MAG TPA: hypothetical protein VNU72_04325 [Puia sp.]|jgi:hypothetical protein|nr:hypothetical protein [Puia sp.]
MNGMVNRMMYGMVDRVMMTMPDRMVSNRAMVLGHCKAGHCDKYHG